MKVIYIDNFRTLAICCIVLTHIVSFFDWSDDVFIKSILVILFENSTSLFMFISGFLFRYLYMSFQYKRYMFKKIKYVGLPYLILSVPAILHFTFLSHRLGVPEDFYEMPIIVQVLSFYLTGAHMAPYWYIPAIFLFFLISPLFILLINRRLLLLVFPLLLMLSLTYARQGVLLSAIHFLSVYVAGMIVCQYMGSLKELFTRRVMILSGCLVFSIPFIQYEVDIDSFRFMYFSKLFLGVWLILMLQKYGNKNLFRFDLSQTSFGIFFIHSYVITAAKMGVLAVSSKYFTGGVFEMILMMGVVIFVCHFLVLAMQKLFGKYSRYVIGS